MDPVRHQAAEQPLAPPQRGAHVGEPGGAGVPVVYDVVVVEDHAAGHRRQQPADFRVEPGFVVEAGVLLVVRDLVARGSSRLRRAASQRWVAFEVSSAYTWSPNRSRTSGRSPSGSVAMRAASVSRASGPTGSFSSAGGAAQRQEPKVTRTASSSPGVRTSEGGKGSRTAARRRRRPAAPRRRCPCPGSDRSPAPTRSGVRRLGRCGPSRRHRRRSAPRRCTDGSPRPRRSRTSRRRTSAAVPGAAPPR